MALLISLFCLIQSPAEKAAQEFDAKWKAVVERTAKENDINETGLTLSSFLANEAMVRAAYLTEVPLDDRSSYVLFGSHWGKRAHVSWKDLGARQRILVEAISAKPALVRLVIRADRYDTYIRARPDTDIVGLGTMNYFPFFSGCRYSDDLIESSIELLRKESTHPAEPLRSPIAKSIVLLTAEEMETSLLYNWEMLCGVCDRLDLLENVTTKNWRARYSELDKWFSKNRPYIQWDNSKSVIVIDKDRQDHGLSTDRDSRSVPELKPPWK